MQFQFTNFQLIVAAAILVVAVYLQRRKAKTAAYHNRFGSEYDRAVLEHGSSRKAEAKLAGRETRVEALRVRELSATERERFLAEWQTVQSRFVDYPKAAVNEADDLIAALVEAPGLSQGQF